MLGGIARGPQFLTHGAGQVCIGGHPAARRAIAVDPVVQGVGDLGRAPTAPQLADRRQVEPPLAIEHDEERVLRGLGATKLSSRSHDALREDRRRRRGVRLGIIDLERCDVHCFRVPTEWSQVRSTHDESAVPALRAHLAVDRSPPMQERIVPRVQIGAGGLLLGFAQFTVLRLELARLRLRPTSHGTETDSTFGATGGQ